MKFFVSVIFAVTAFATATAQHKVNIIVDSKSVSNTNDTIYIAGSFNGWSPNDKKFMLTNNSVTLSVPDVAIEFKFTKGSWEKTECNKDSSMKDNRILNIKNDTTVHVTIDAWQDEHTQQPVKYTSTKQVHILNTAFYIPQLNRTRRLWIYLPKDYQEGKNRYPVIYMQDGQNLFDAATAFAGEWGVDEFMDTTKLPKCIIVGIDHGGDKRLTEYNPYDNKKYGKGEGKLYVQFLIKTLKPFIDKKYRTLKDADHTIIAGSSMGGLISMYAVIAYPKVFGKAGVFSPAFWIAGNDLFKDLKMAEKDISAKIYIYIGGKEGENMLADAKTVADNLKINSKATTKLVIDADGTHSEKAWQKQFPGFYKWMMK